MPCQAMIWTEWQRWNFWQIKWLMVPGAKCSIPYTNPTSWQCVIKNQHGLIYYIYYSISPSSQAPACQLGSLARAAVKDGATSQSLHDASKVHRSHGERDAHRVLNKYWLSLKVPIKHILVGPVEGGQSIDIPYYKVGG